MEGTSFRMHYGLSYGGRGIYWLVDQIKFLLPMSQKLTRIVDLLTSVSGVVSAEAFAGVSGAKDVLVEREVNRQHGLALIVGDDGHARLEKF